MTFQYIVIGHPELAGTKDSIRMDFSFHLHHRQSESKDQGTALTIWKMSYFPHPLAGEGKMYEVPVQTFFSHTFRCAVMVRACYPASMRVYMLPEFHSKIY